MTITLSNGKQIDLNHPACVIGLTSSEIKELVQICKSINETKEAA